MSSRKQKRSSEPRRGVGKGKGTAEAGRRRPHGRAAAVSGPAAEQQRTLIAQAAARIVIEQGISDYGTAKRKAAERLGQVAPALLPTNREVESAVVEHQRLFGGAQHTSRLRALREGACEAMRFFAAFEPRLVGPVLSGAVSAHSPVTLHLFTDDPEAVPRRLLDHGIPHRVGERRLRFGAERTRTCPVHAFSVEGIEYEAVVQPLDAIREAPISPVDGRPQRRASLVQVQELLAAEADDERGAGDPLP